MLLLYDIAGQIAYQEILGESRHGIAHAHATRRRNVVGRM